MSCVNCYSDKGEHDEFHISKEASFMFSRGITTEVMEIISKNVKVGIDKGFDLGVSSERMRIAHALVKCGKLDLKEISEMTGINTFVLNTLAEEF